MPRREELPQVPQGQPYGQAARQEEFIQATKAEPLPPLPQPQEQRVALPPEERPTPNVEGEFNLDEILFGPTERPLEPVTAGLRPEFRVPISEHVRMLVESSPSPDLVELLEEVRNLGL